MDGQRFDVLAKTMASTSRRHALRLLAGGALGAAFSGTALRAALAQDVGIESTSPVCKNEKKFCYKSGGAGFQCTNNGNCHCAVDVDKHPYCVDTSAFVNSCPDRHECSDNKDCGSNEVCILLQDCCSKKRRKGCAPKCG